LVRGVVRDGQAYAWGITIPVIGSPADGECELFIRPEHVRLAMPGDSIVPVTVETSTFLGSIRRTLVRTSDDQLLTMQHAVEEHFDVGASINVTIVPVPVAVRPRL